MELSQLWFILVAVLWVGYLFLEGFDFGVGMAMPFIAKTDTEKRLAINSIGPVWDGNEVWVLVAGGATFAAFPEWYATLFSGFYLPLFLILLALIVRGVAFEYRSKRPEESWRKNWDRAIVFGSFVPALLWGVAFANIVRGVKIDQNFEYVGGFFDLLNPYSLLGGITTLLLFFTHGLIFLALKNQGELRERAHSLAFKVAPLAILALASFGLWTLFAVVENNRRPLSLIIALIVGVSVYLLLALKAKSEGKAFAATGLIIALVVVFLFGTLYPNVMPSSINDAYNLTIKNASSTEYTLKVMTVVAVIFVPIVLAYQGWTYWIFRSRLIAPTAGIEIAHDKPGDSQSGLPGANKSNAAESGA